MFLCLFGLQWVMPKRVVDLFNCWKGRFGRHPMEAYGMPYLYASYGVFGENVMHEVSQIVRRQFRSYSFYSWRPSLLVLEFLVYVFYTSRVHGLRPFALLMNFIYFQKERTWFGFNSGEEEVKISSVQTVLKCNI